MVLVFITLQYPFQVSLLTLWSDDELCWSDTRVDHESSRSFCTIA
jgi:hypothetical protein